MSAASDGSLRLRTWLIRRFPTDNSATGPEFTLTTKGGRGHKGKVTYSGTTGCSPQVAGAGFDGNIGVQSDVPYLTSGDTVCFVPDASRVVSMPVSFSIVCPNGAALNGCCHSTANYTFNSTCFMPFGTLPYLVTYASGS